MWLVAVLRAVLNSTSVNHKWAEANNNRYPTSTSAELFCSTGLFYPFNLNSSSFFVFILLCCCALYLFGWLPQNISYTSSTPESVTQYSDNAHEQGITRSLFVLYHHRRGLHSNGGYEDTAGMSLLIQAQTAVITYIQNSMFTDAQWILSSTTFCSFQIQQHNQQ